MIKNIEKERKTDRVIVLKPIPGKQVKNSLGMSESRAAVDSLRAVMDSQTCLWEFRYKGAVLPEPLRQKFTSFRELRTYAEGYFGRRNLEIVEVRD